MLKRQIFYDTHTEHTHTHTEHTNTEHTHTQNTQTQSTQTQNTHKQNTQKQNIHTHTHTQRTHTQKTYTHTHTHTHRTHTHTHRTQICYRLQFQNPTVNLSALCNSCVKIACFSSQLIFTFLYAASSRIQNASERAIRLVQPPLLRKFRPSSNPTKTIKLRFKPHCLGNQSEPATCCSVH